jgi:hypothetical protein
LAEFGIEKSSENKRKKYYETVIVVKKEGLAGKGRVQRASFIVCSRGSEIDIDRLGK